GPSAAPQAQSRHTARAGQAGPGACAAPEAQAGPQDAPAECDGAALCPHLGAMHHGADGHAGGGGVCQTDVDRRDLSRLASSLGCPSGCRWPADRGDGRTPDRRGLLGLSGADAPRPARGRGSHEPATKSTMDRDRPDQLVLVRSTTVHRSWLRLEQLAGSAMGKSAAAGDHYSSPAYVRDCLAISPSGGSLTQRWPLPRGAPTWSATAQERKRTMKTGISLTQLAQELERQATT